MNPIPYGKQTITEDDIKAVVETLKSDFLTQGPHIAEFEKAFASYIGSKYAVAVANGTAALHLSAMALNMKPGQKVITTPITFVASANCIRYCGGEVVFADIDPSTYLIDIVSIERLLRASPKGTYAGIIPVDFSGRAVDLEKLKSLASEFNLWILEDACHAPGGFFIDSKGQKQLCGNGRFAELAIFSFHPVKHIACGEGGMITTNDPVLYEKLLVLRTHGITRNTELFQNDAQWASGNTKESVINFPAWYMEMQELGFNYRLTDFQAALGSSQLKRAEQGLARRKEIARKYSAAFKSKPWVLGHSGFVEGHAYHLYILETENRLELYNFLRSKNIFPQIHYIPAHLMPYYKMRGYKEGEFTNSEQYYSRCLSLPMYPGLTDEQQDYVIENILAFSKR
ncbi:MAG: UDP-4-amino-4,6-dideoxy-N-acetyl-beta-L-altrosamine transaminase [Bacteroidetes bacterium]|nr:UDP-4-amino-4,6-dideoxy-N-acetyl-beta-L-altrosamine transaminase [Bacteroidota bacterium]MBK9542244.1 UDP-4-amino-4,6-dideoxy-N-acetyl-beta-L-altrosamine transaminase [Bacteroidota bacterium]MBP6402843.1 UDP-4-amino-4,6-dideoxy-N-acetyl-beta-L-altrosamine transaminase [Bacteroidia bacterium]MBP6648707.1 UDP-4-amino-4,6-dideoxy-N-acetyl-beta-L-altrosamine transaminase [Bacteroidia bacterium]